MPKLAVVCQCFLLIVCGGFCGRSRQVPTPMNMAVHGRLNWKPGKSVEAYVNGFIGCKVYVHGCIALSVLSLGLIMWSAMVTANPRNPQGWWKPLFPYDLTPLIRGFCTANTQLLQLCFTWPILDVSARSVREC